MQNAGTIGGTAGLDATRPQCRDLPLRLSRRPATADDRDFLRALFAESRPELALLPETVRAALTQMQFDSQSSQYRSSAPEAVDWILELDHDGRAEPVGRCYLLQGRQEHRLLDLSIRCQWRRNGFAGIVLARLCTGAATARVPLRLTVWQANHDALRLYQRHGFVVDDAGPGHGLAGYVRLRWSGEGRR